MANWWMINDKSGEMLIDFWVKNAVVTIGWNEIGNALDYETKDKLLIRCDEVYSKEMPGTRIQIESQVWRFSREIENGDRIITYNNVTGQYYIGIVTSGYEYNPNLYGGQPHILRIKWVDKRINENFVSKELKDSLNQNSVVFRVFNCDAEIERLLISNGNVKEALDKGKEIYNSVTECVKDMLLKMDERKFKQLVREMLTCLNYKVSANYDNSEENSYLIISEDDLALTKTIIRVCCLNDNEIKTSQNVLNLFSSYNDNIRKYVVISNSPISLQIRNEISEKYYVAFLSINDIVKKLFECYDKMSDEVKKALSLKRVYI